MNRESRRSLLWILGTLISVVSIAQLAGQAAASMTVVRTDGTTVQGSASGFLMFAIEAEKPDYVLVRPDAVERLDSKGIHLRSGVTLIHAAMSLASNPKVYRGTSKETIVRAVLLLTPSLATVPEKEKLAMMLTRMTGEGKGTGYGTIDIPNGKIFYAKRQAATLEKLTIIGQVVGEGGKATVRDNIEIRSAVGVVTVPSTVVARPPYQQ